MYPDYASQEIFECRVLSLPVDQPVYGLVTAFCMQDAAKTFLNALMSCDGLPEVVVIQIEHHRRELASKWFVMHRSVNLDRQTMGFEPVCQTNALMEMAF